AGSQVGEQVADVAATLTIGFEAEGALQEPSGLAEEGVDPALAGEFLAVVAGQVGLVVEGIDVTDGAGGEDLHDALHLGHEVRRAGSVGRGGRRLMGGGVLVEEPGHGDAAEPAAGLPEKVTAGERGHWRRGRVLRNAECHTGSSRYRRYMNSLAF